MLTVGFLLLFFLQYSEESGRPVNVPMADISDHVFKSNLSGLVDEMANNHTFLIYMSQLCSLCVNATQLMDTKHPSVSYEFYEYDKQPGGIFLMSEVMRRNSATLLPQIYICKQYIGGWTELDQLDKSNQLETKAKNC